MQSRKGSVGGASQASASSISLGRTPSTDGSVPLDSPLIPCAASLRNVIYAQDSSVLCLKHDSLTLERKFDLHTEPVSFIAIDNSNPERPRVVSVDTSKLAIVWDLETGAQLAKHSSYEELRCAAWMKNGNLVFGDTMGNVILFDPTREESISARTIFNPLTAIAPGADCRSFALGYENGSILVAALAPSFTILHTLTTTSLSPSPITTLAWHASSSKQKSDMLAVQTREGDLRVWSVPKSLENEDSARVVRVLKRQDYNRRGNNWLGWSRNGRIVQYSEGASSIWDVRTKTVTWEPVPTFDNVAGICVYGPKGVLFTIGKDATVQQFSLYPPALEANVLQRPALPPPSPPVSIDEKTQEPELLQSDTLHTDSEDNTVDIYSSQDEMRLKSRRSGAIPKPLDITIIDQSHNSLGLTRDPPGSASSDGSYKSHRSSRSSASHTGPNRPDRHSKSSRGSIDAPEPSPPTPIPSPPAFSTSRRPSVSTTPQASPKPIQKLHPLRQELHISPETSIAVNQLASPVSEVGHLFANIKLRMVHVTYESPRFNGNQRGGLTADDRRKEMLWCLFGWKGDIEDLIGDELESVNARSLSALTLRMWLNDIDENSLNVLLGSDFLVSSDWLFVALAASGGIAAWASVARAFVCKLVQKNEFHMAVVLLLAIGDKEQAVDIYLNQNMYLEATLLTTLLWRTEWPRIARLVRQWGEFSRDTHDTQLAARCFACAGDVPQDIPPVPKRAPSMLRQRSNSQSKDGNKIRGFSISGPSNPRATLKMTPKLNLGSGTGGLKLITSFPESPREPVRRSATTSPAVTGVNRFFYNASQRSAAATPIAMSAVTPIEPYWQNDPITAKPISKAPQLPAVVEASPASATPVQRLPPTTVGMKISSPIEAKTSNGFTETLSGATFGDMQHAASPSQYMAPAPPPLPQSTTLGDISRQPSPPISRGAGNKPIPKRSQTPGVTRTTQASIIAGIPRSQTAAPRLPTVGLQVQFPPMDGILKGDISSMPQGPSLSQLRGHGRKGSLSRPSPPVPARSLTSPTTDHNNIDTFMSLLEKNNKRLDSQRASPRGSHRIRQESPDRRRRGKPRDLSLNRGRTTEIKRTAHMRSPSTPLPFNSQAALYRDEPDAQVVEDTPEPLTGRFYGDDDHLEERGRSATKHDQGPFWRSPSSPPAYHTEQHAHYRYDPQDRINDEDERYYTTAPAPPAPRMRDDSRGRQMHLQPSYERSPSSPLPLSPQAQLFKEMSEQVEREHELQEQRQPRRTVRNESRGRPPTRNWNNSVRRSRSENTMRQWGDRLERAGAFAPSPLSRQLSTCGLPSNPRAWQDELRSPSCDRSPGARGRSNSRAAFITGRDTREVSPATRVNDGSRGRSMSRLRGGDEGMKAAPAPPPPPMMQRQQYSYGVDMPFHSSPVPAEYESIGSPLDTVLPQFPDSLAHRRNQSTPAALEPLIRKLPPQPPLASPPPLPANLPVHPALQLHLDPTMPGGKKMSEKLGGAHARSIRRIPGANNINSPIDRWDQDGEHDREHGIVVGLGLEADEVAAIRSKNFWGGKGTPQLPQQAYQMPDYEPDYMGDMQRMRGHTKTPSIGASNHF